MRRFSQNLRPRILLCVEALANEAERRGYHVTPTGTGIEIIIRGRAHAVDFKEPQDRSDHIPTVEEVANDAKWSWRAYPRYDYTPSGRLRISTVGIAVTDSKPRADGTITRKVENRLAEVLRRIEETVEYTEALENRRREDAAARRRNWEQVHEQALLDYAEHVREQALLDQAARYAETQRVDEYLAALDGYIETMRDHDQRREAEEWRTWAHAHRAARDPFASPPSMPQVPKPTADALAPFMRGLSPWGPA